MPLTLDEVLLSHPDLTSYGFENQNFPSFTENRNELKNSRSAFNELSIIFASIAKTKSINRKYTNSTLKGIFKHHCNNYITLGVVIAAAISEGFEFHQSGEIVYLNMSSKSIKKYE